MQYPKYFVKNQKSPKFNLLNKTIDYWIVLNNSGDVKAISCKYNRIENNKVHYFPMASWERWVNQEYIKEVTKAELALII